MTGIDFQNSNRMIAKDQPEYLTLPAHVSATTEGTVTTCWKPTLKERLKLVFGGAIWLQVLTFCKPLQPLKMSVDKPELTT